jgi:hypothetical protein
LTKDDKDVSYDGVTLMADNKTLWLTCNDNPEACPAGHAHRRLAHGDLRE